MDNVFLEPKTGRRFKLVGDRKVYLDDPPAPAPSLRPLRPQRPHPSTQTICPRC